MDSRLKAQLVAESCFDMNGRYQSLKSLLSGKWWRRLLAGAVIGLVAGTRLLGQTTQPVVAIHDSEFTRILETLPASGATPTGPGYTSKEWWPTNWHYFVMPESIDESLRSDGTAHTMIGDSNIIAGQLLIGGVPRYPILISLAAEAIHDDEIAPLTNYVAAGGFLFVGSSSFTRYPNGVSRGNFALADAMGINAVQSALTNWSANTAFVKQDEHRLVAHIPDGTLSWRMPAAAEEINFGVSPSHNFQNAHLLWQVAATNATILARGNIYPYLVIKPFGKGWFIYYAPMQPLVGHGGWAPSMYAYGIFRNAIEWAFETARLPVPRLSPWPYAYDAAFMLRRDLENYKDEIANIESSAQFESALGGKGDYYFCTGSLRVELGNSPTVIAGLRRAVTNYGATIGAHNGGLPNPGNPALILSDYDYWHWGPDEVLDLTPTNYSSGKQYAFISLSNSFVDVDGWFAGIDMGPRAWVGCYFNATREDSFDIQSQLNVKINGEQKVGPFPHWTLSTATSGKRYPMLSQPLSDWFVGSQALQVAQSLEYHNTSTVRAGIDYFYSLGGLINFYSHTLTTGMGPAGSVATEYATYGLNTNRFPRLWSANAVSIYNWWVQRSNVQVSVIHTTTNGNTSETVFTVVGANNSATTVELLLPAAGRLDGLLVQTNGTVATGSAWRINNQSLKVLVGNSVTNVLVRYTLNPMARDDYYSVMKGRTLLVPSSGVLRNDQIGLGGTNLTAQLVSNVVSGTVSLTNGGGFSYLPNSNFLGVDVFSYTAHDGVSNSQPASAFISVLPEGIWFMDDFSRQTGFTKLGPWYPVSGNWSVTNGALLGNCSAHTYADVKVDGNWTNYAVQGTIRFAPGGYGAGFGGRLNPTTGAHYAAWVYPEGSAGGSSVLKLIKYLSWGNWSGTPMAQVTLPGVGTNTHLLRAVFEGNRIRIFYDSVLYADVTDNNFGGVAAYSAGGISAGLYTYLAAYNCVFDDVSVTVIGSPPVANDDSYSIFPNASLTVSVPGLLYNDAGGNGQLNVYLVNGTTNGVLTLNSNGSLTYTPATNYAGEDAFVYRAIDGVTNSPSAVAIINVFTPDLPPVASGDYYFVPAQQSLVVNPPGVLANDTDPAGNSMTAALLTPPTHGQLTLNSNGGFVYSPATNYTGPDEFVYQANAGTSNSATATVQLLVQTTGMLFADDFARPTNTSSISPWIAQSGSWIATNNVLQGAGELQNYSFVYLTNRWTNYAISARIQLPTNAFAGGLGIGLNPTNGTQYAAWLYPGSPGLLRLIKFQNWTSWGLNGSGAVPIAQAALPGLDANWHTVKLALRQGQLAVYFDGVQVLSVADPEPAAYLSGAVSLGFWTGGAAYQMQVDDVAIIPITVSDTFAMEEDQVLVVPAAGVLANDTAVFGPNLLASLVASTTNGVLNLSSNGGFTYSPVTNFYGVDSFSYLAIDGPTNLGVISVTINTKSVNDPPLLPTQPNRIVKVMTTLVVTNTATDVDLPPDVLSYQLISPPTGMTINQNGVISWTPTQLQEPSTNLIVTVANDGIANTTNSFLVEVTQNSSPVLSPLANRTIHAGAVLRINCLATDAETNAITFSLDVSPPGASINPTNGSVVWPTFATNVNTTNLLTVRATDNGLPPLSDTQSFWATVVSLPLITNIAVSNGVAALTWTAIPNQGYRLQYKDELGATNWTTSPSEIIAGGTTANATNAVNTQGWRFYRVLVTP